MHLHSSYSLATAKGITPESLAYSALIKGLDIIGTGDILHPEWLRICTDSLEGKNGFYSLSFPKNQILPDFIKTKNLPEFILTTELSCIYKNKGKTRKNHLLIIFPSLTAVMKVQKKLMGNGFNLFSDGRPILGISSKKLAILLWEIDPSIIIIPAHIWTPWFSMLGSKSGYNNPYDCFEELLPYIYAMETGLSTDPSMHWKCSFLDDYALVSNSDAHSPDKLARNASIFKGLENFNDFRNALINHKTLDNFLGTVNLFPQEGKYYHDGHRKCKINISPSVSEKYKGVCPVCGKKLTLGVLNRIEELADRNDPQKRPYKKNFVRVIPLKNLIAHTLKKSNISKSVQLIYTTITEQCSSELPLLLTDNQTEIENKLFHTFGPAGENKHPLKLNTGEIDILLEKLPENIMKSRNGEVDIIPGYDGEFGIITPKN